MTKSRTQQSTFNRVFKRIQKREVLESPPFVDQNELNGGILNAALSKCIDLNVIMNDRKLSKENGFLFLANLRGVAEDLIVLDFIQNNMGDDDRIWRRTSGGGAAI